MKVIPCGLFKPLSKNLFLRILILGNDGRAHAFCWKINQSPYCEHLFIAPGNAGTSEYGTNIPISINDFEQVKNTCLENAIDYVLVSPEEPLVNGIYDFFQNDPELKQTMITGPSMLGAKLEGSKAFAKSFMKRNGIQTAGYGEFTLDTYEDGLTYLKDHSLPVVLKADGLAGGKGVVICQNHIEALSEYELMIQKSKFGEAGKKLIIEEFLAGIELSVFVLTDGKNYVILPEAKDYKKIKEGDLGLNTGGMGAISPVPFAGDTFLAKVKEKIIEPTMQGLIKENIDYKGFIFFGLIKVGDEPVLIEYNCRMGDPETEVVLLRLKNDIMQLLISTARQELDKEKIEIDKKSAATIVAVSGGYPLEYEKGFEIDFGYLNNPNAIKHIDEKGGVKVFHAGTTDRNGHIVTNGGRVLAVSALADNMVEAIQLSKEILDQIHFDGMYYRTDIGYEFIE
ncbi:phosphoribosylamine--glycine ligase [soil metagenome]